MYAPEGKLKEQLFVYHSNNFADSIVAACRFRRILNGDDALIHIVFAAFKENFRLLVISNLYKTDKWLVWVAICGSLLLSIWANYIDDIVNNDGIEYIKSAAAILQGDWATALHTYKWPFYSLTIAFTSLLSGLSLTMSAYVVNAFFNAWLVIAFVALVRLLGGNRSTLWFAVLVILAFPTINKFRPYLIRDPAFLALFLSACYAFFLYIKGGLKRYNAMSIACFMLAALFRLEGLIYLLLTQAYLFNRHFTHRGNRLLSLFALLILLAILVVFISWWQFSSTGELGYSSIFTQPLRFFETTWGQFGEAFAIRVEEYALTGHSRAYALMALSWSAASIVFLELVHTLYYLYFFLWLVAWRKGLLFPETSLYASWRFLVLASLLVLFGFVMVQWFLADRYSIAAALLLLLATPFLLASWYEQRTKQGAHKGVFWLVIALIVLSGLKSFDLGTKKHYLKAAADWMTDSLPVGARIYTNNRILGHYFDREIKVGDYWSTRSYYEVDALLAKKHMDYAAITVKPEDMHFLDRTTNMLNRKILVVFENEKGAQVRVFDFKQRPDAKMPDPIYVK